MKMKKIGTVVSLSLLGVFAVAQVSDAAIVMYTDRATFMSQLNASYTEDFNGLDLEDPDGLGAVVPFSDTAFSFTVNSVTVWAVDGAGYNRGVSADAAEDPMIFDSFSPAINALGGDFFLTSDAGSEDQANGLVVVGVNGSAPENIDYTGQAVEFRGWIATAGESLNSLSVATSSGQYVSADNFVVGTIPEPAVAGLIAIAGCGMLGVRRFFRD